MIDCSIPQPTRGSTTTSGVGGKGSRSRRRLPSHPQPNARRRDSQDEALRGGVTRRVERLLADLHRRAADYWEPLLSLPRGLQVRRGRVLQGHLQVAGSAASLAMSSSTRFGPWIARGWSSVSVLSRRECFRRLWLCCARCFRLSWSLGGASPRSSRSPGSYTRLPVPLTRKSRRSSRPRRAASRRPHRQAPRHVSHSLNVARGQGPGRTAESATCRRADVPTR